MYRETEAFRQKKKKNQSGSSPLHCTYRSSGQLTAHHSHSCPSKVLPAQRTENVDLPEDATGVRQIVSQSRQIQHVCLVCQSSCYLLSAINPTLPPP